MPQQQQQQQRLDTKTLRGASRQLERGLLSTSRKKVANIARSGKPRQSKLGLAPKPHNQTHQEAGSDTFVSGSSLLEQQRKDSSSSLSDAVLGSPPKVPITSSEDAVETISVVEVADSDSDVLVIPAPLLLKVSTRSKAKRSQLLQSQIAFEKCGKYVVTKSIPDSDEESFDETRLSNTSGNQNLEKKGKRSPSLDEFEFPSQPKKLRRRLNPSARWQPQPPDTRMQPISIDTDEEMNPPKATQSRTGQSRDKNIAIDHKPRQSMICSPPYHSGQSCESASEDGSVMTPAARRKRFMPTSETGTDLGECESRTGIISDDEVCTDARLLDKRLIRDSRTRTERKDRKSVV